MQGHTQAASGVVKVQEVGYVLVFGNLSMVIFTLLMAMGELCT